jgi:hypothetical protein
MAKAPAITAVTYRLGISSIVFLPITISVLWKNKIVLANDRMPILIAATCMAGHFGFWIAFLDYAPIESSTFRVTCNSVLVAIISRLFPREHIHIYSQTGGRYRTWIMWCNLN